MSRTTDPSDPALMTPESRLVEIASILAEAVLRLHVGAALGGVLADGASPVDSIQIGLDECGESLPHGHRG